MSLPLLPLLAAAAIGAADSTTYVVVNHGRPAGDMVVARRGDSLVVRYQHVDRNRGQWVEHRYRLGPGGEPVSGDAAPFDPATGQRRDVTERFEIVNDSVRWTLRGGQPGSAPLAPGSYYRLRTSGTPWEQAQLARHLLRQPERTTRMLPAGTARVELAGDTVVTTAQGPQRVRLAMIYRGGNTPSGVWLDERDALFASEAAWFITVRQGAEQTLPALRAVEVRFRERQAAEVARRLARPADATIVVRNGDLFDSERGTVRPRTTVVVRGDRIVAVGPADSVATPAGATVIDATGKTVMPGLWDMHTHLHLGSQTSGSLLQLAHGLTTVRDLAADLDAAVSHRDRADAGTIVSPRVLLAGFIEGPGRWAGPSEVLARTEEEARAWVARYDSLGYRQIKLYNLVHPDLVPTIAREAKARGLRLSGHVPRGLSTAAAIRLGFDEINHVAFLLSSFYQDSLYTPQMRAYSLVAQIVAPTFDVDGAGMTELIRTMKEHGTVLDGTFNLWATPAPGTTAADSANARATTETYLKLIRRLHEAGVTLVPGTDNSAGTTFLAELELYERAGIPAATVLQLATIVSARVMKDDRDHGSLAPGKVADLLIVDGKPAERVGDLRRIAQVMRAGRVYTPAELREAVGTGR